MRHNVYGKKLGRNKDERDLLFKSLVFNLFSYGTIETTNARAKAIKGSIDKIINLGKTNKYLFESYLPYKNLRERTIKEVLPKLSTKTSGYTSVVRLGQRRGDATIMVRMSLIGAEKLEPVARKEVSRGEKVSQVPQEAKQQITRGTRKPRGTVKLAVKKATHPSKGNKK